MRAATIMFAVVMLTGCRATTSSRGHFFFLPEDSFLTVKTVESLVPVGTPIEDAREIMEDHGFVCTYEETVEIPYLQCNQITKRRLWPFNGSWMATLFIEEGFVKSVQARYDLNPSEIGVRIPKRTGRKARAIDRAKDAAAAHSAGDGMLEPLPMDGPIMAPPPELGPTASIVADDSPLETVAGETP
jgi:hypothetical protein